MTRIAFIGIGGVGGYFGGMMSKYYKDSNEVEIYFICKDATAQHIRSHGLKLETTHGDYIIHPNLVDINLPQSIVFDYIICCTKSFDLQSSLIPIKKYVGSETVVIPLLNGVNSYDSIRSILPDTEVWDACVYIVARLIERASIQESGGIQLLFFGSRNQYSDRLKIFEQLLNNAGIKAKHSEHILQTIWEKFIFISSIATLTSRLNKSIGEILSTEEYKSMFHSLLYELKTLADAKNIGIPENIFETIYDKMYTLPFEATSSMHRDFQNGRRTELETLTGSVVRMAAEIELELPVYKKSYQALKAKEIFLHN